MTPEAMARRVLDLLPSGVDGAVIAAAGTSSLTRFANSFIHQNMSEVGTSLSLTSVWDGRVSSSSGNVTPEGLESFVDHAVAATRIAPPNPDWPGLTPPTEIPPSVPVPDSTAEASPEDRARAVGEFVAAGDDMRAAGYCQTGTSSVIFANTAGHTASGMTASAILDGIHQTLTSAGSGHAASRSFDDIDGAAVGSLAADRARRGVTSVDLDPGEYEVVLAPEAVATLVLFLGFYGFNGKALNEGQSFVRVGDRQFDEAFELFDDGLDERSTKLRFDSEGTPKRRMPLITEGVTANAVFDRREAAEAGTESTGHAVTFFGQNFGPLPTDLFLTPGTSTPEDLIGGVERGLYVSTFNYVRILDPRTTVATGLTRNGTFLIENGEITSAVSDMRFTQSFAAAVGPGRVLGLGIDARFADSEFGPAIAHVPTARLAGWRFTGGAAG
jgi:predicted Zn-dependent protease